MKHLVVLLLLSATGSALASETPEVPRPKKRHVEEVIVTGYTFDKPETVGMLMMGLSGAYLIHEYDSVRNEWRFVRASNQKKEMKNND
jgi:hypothetical protein